MHVVYNGVELALAEIQDYQREAVYSPDGADLLYVKHRLSVTALCAAGGWPTAINITPGANVSGDLSGSVSRNPDTRLSVKGTDPATYTADQTDPNLAASVGNVNYPAGMTDHELRMRLMIPRQKLIVSAYRTDGSRYVWLESPRSYPRTVQIGTGTTPYAEATPSDAANGPLPLRCDVIQPSGDGVGAFGVNFMIETCLVPTAPEAERLILSHRWEVTHSYDEDFHLTRITRGLVVFNGGLQRLTLQTPDWYRNTFMHPIPLGFRRGVPEVKATSDGLGVQYTITDTDPHVVFDPGDSGATNMDIIETLNYFVPNAVSNSNEAAGAAMFGLGQLLK